MNDEIDFLEREKKEISNKLAKILYELEFCSNEFEKLKEQYTQDPKSIKVIGALLLLEKKFKELTMQSIAVRKSASDVAKKQKKKTN